MPGERDASSVPDEVTLAENVREFVSVSAPHVLVRDVRLDARRCERDASRNGRVHVARGSAMSVSIGLGLAQYPFSQTRRFEFNAGYTRYAFDREVIQYFYDPTGQVQVAPPIQQEVESPDPLNFVEASAARVPLLVLTADRPPELRDAGANQTIDQVKLFGSYVRWQFDLPVPAPEVDPAVLLTTVDQAVYRARRTPGGP